MADKVSFEMVSPDRLLKTADVDMVIVPGMEGDFGVLPGHAPLISTMRPGVVEIHDEGNDVEQIFVRGGFAEVTTEGVTILAEEAIAMADLGRGQLEQEVSYAREDIDDAKTDEARDRAQHKFDQLIQLLDALD
ncbi:MAG TPA: F0F1 ATP synthase subunit epsilon [Sneathiellales bacterium]|nr:F0F1 ATP synthase subunit epsilon [Sneathiellales bacterium]